MAAVVPSAGRVNRSPSPAVPARPVRRFTVREYDQMIRSGVLGEDERLELINGWILPQMPRNAPHDSGVYRLRRRLEKLLGDEWVIRDQSAMAFPTSVPEPDVAVVRGPEERYDARRPTARDAVFVAEVADSTLTYDRGDKLALYARNKIPVYWIVNVADRQVEVYTDPHGGRNPTYRTRTDYPPETDVPVVIAGETVGRIPAGELLP